MLEGTTERASSGVVSASSTPQTLSFALTPATTHALTLEYCVTSGGTMSLADVRASRAT